MMEMPPLPDAGLIYMGLTGNPEHAYSGAQMRAFGESCARMAREEAAKLCEEFDGQGGKRGWNQAVNFCAAAIRKG